MYNYGAILILTLLINFGICASMTTVQVQEWPVECSSSVQSGGDSIPSVVEFIANNSECLVDMRPCFLDKSKESYSLVACCFGISGFIDGLKDYLAIDYLPDSMFLNLIKEESIYCTRNKNKFSLESFTNTQEGLKFFNQNDRWNLNNALTLITNNTYWNLARSLRLVHNSDGRLVFDSKKQDLSRFFNRNCVLSSWRFFLIDGDDNICATVGLNPHQTAAPESSDGNGNVIPVNPSISAADSFLIDYYVLDEYRSSNGTHKGVGRIALCEILKAIFGEKDHETAISNAILNIRPDNVGSLTIAYKSGFRSFGEFELSDPSKMNYILRKKDFFKDRGDILAGNCTKSDDLACAIEAALKEQKSRIANQKPRSPKMSENKGDSVKRSSSDFLRPNFSLGSKRRSRSQSISSSMDSYSDLSDGDWTPREKSKKKK